MENPECRFNGNSWCVLMGYASGPCDDDNCPMVKTIIEPGKRILATLAD